MWLAVLVLYTLIRGASLQTYLQQASSAINVGNYSGALYFYNKAVGQNSQNYVAIYLRGSLQELLGHGDSALRDYTNALTINSDFIKARQDRAQLYVKLGLMKEAISDYDIIIKGSDSNAALEAKKKVQDVRNLEKTKMEISKLFSKKLYREAFDLSEKIIKTIYMDISFRRVRSQLLQELHENKLRISELVSLSQLQPNDLDLYVEISKEMYIEGMLDDSISTLRKCLSMDPDQSSCKASFRSVRKLQKSLVEIEQLIATSRYEDAVKQSLVLLHDQGSTKVYQQKAESYLCQAYAKINDGNFDVALKHCATALSLDPDDINVRIARAAIYIDTELYDEAKADYNAVLDKHPRHEKATEGLQKIDKILSNAKRRDYYKILNVSRKATKDQINRAYRKMARENHPDRFQDPEQVKKAKKTLQDLNAAHSVLTDDEKRRRFDEGSDPLDPNDMNHGPSSGGTHRSGGYDSFFNFFRGGPQHHFEDGHERGGHNQFHFTFG